MFGPKKKSEADIFRKSALDRLSSPEQLDRLVTVTSPKGWMALLMLAIMIAIGIAWGIVGIIPSRVTGEGILLTRGGQVYNAAAPSDGTLVQLTVDVDSRVERDEVIGVISREDVRVRLTNAEAVVAERTAELREVQDFIAREEEVKTANFERQRAALRQRVDALRQRERFLGQKLRDEEDLLARKVVTRQAVAATRDEYNRTTSEVAEALSQLASIDSRELEMRGQGEDRLRRTEQSLREAERQVRELSRALEQNTLVLAPAAGRVTELKAAVGSLVRAGQPLLALETEGEGLEMLLYVPPSEGKKIGPGMKVQVSPSTVKREEYGSVLGRVTSVSDFPTTVDGMRAVLQNDDLARQFSAKGPPYLVRVALEPDTGTTSGYAWTSQRAAELPLSSGTIGQGEIVVFEQAPITLVVPLLREWTGL